MENEPVFDAKNIWQNQPAEPLKMPIELLRRRLDQFHEKSRLGLYSLWCLGILVIAAGGFSFWVTSRGVVRIASILWIAWAIYVMYQAGKRGWPGRAGSDITPSACLQFYRAELLRKREFVREIGRWFLLPALPCVLVTTSAAAAYLRQNPRVITHSLPFLSMLAIWLFLFLRVRKRDDRDLELEIDTLDAFVDSK